MVYTVTFNPAIDYVMQINDINEGMTNRSVSEEIYFGGKGINVSLVLAQLKKPTTALGFIAGFTGQELKREIEKSGVKTDFIRLENGFTRINVKLKNGVETEINAQGPHIDENAVNELYKKLEKLKSGDILVLAGSVPSSLPKDIYEKILEKLKDKGIKFVVDATNDLLTNTLKYKPFLIKPNLYELEEIFDKKLNTDDEIIECAKKLQEKGAQNVLVSLGQDGAILIDENKVAHKSLALIKNAVNTVGAGDSMVAGFLAGIDKGYDYALLLGSAAGGATACNKGLATKEDILKLITN